MTENPPPPPPASGRRESTCVSPLPLAGGVGGGQFKPRNTERARALRNTATPAERLLWRALSNRKLAGHKFSRQMPIGPYFADFLCREARLVVEIDGYSHDLRQDHDRQRDHFMAAQGYRVIRFTHDDAMNSLDGLVTAIAVVLAETSPPLTPPACGRGTSTEILTDAPHH